MKQKTSNRSFYGIIAPVITPLKNQDTLDSGGLERLINHLITGGVHGLFILGTTGEAPGLSYRLQNEMIEQTCDLADSRLPVLAGITDTSFTESIRLAEKAKSCGVSAVVAAPPYYFLPNQNELVNYYQLLADKLPLPLFLYNMPSHTKVSIAPGSVRKLAAHENIIGLKDSSADLVYYQKVIQAAEDAADFRFFTGPEEILMQAILSGGHGGVTGGANMFPELYVEMYNAAKAFDIEKMEKLQQKIMNVSIKLYSIGNSPAGYLQGVKSALSLLGICSDQLALPYHSHSAKEKNEVKRVLDELNESITT